MDYRIKSKKKWFGLLTGILLMAVGSLGCQRLEQHDAENEELAASFFPMNYHDFQEAVNLSNKMYLCSSKEDLLQYMEDTKDIFVMEKDYSNFLENHHDTYFKYHDLVIVTDIEPSGGNRLTDATVEMSADGHATIVISRKLPQIGTADIAVWSVMIPVEKDYVEEEAIYSVEYEDSMQE